MRDAWHALLRGVRRFAEDRSGAVTVEFVIAVPLLLAVLAFAVQYGYAMQVRNALDVAVRDAARYLSRAPVDAATATVDGAFVTKAQNLVRARISATATVTVNDLFVSEAGVAIKATASVQLPIFSAISALSGQPGIDHIDMVACEAWTVSESRDVTGTFASALSGSPFAGCPADVGAMAGTGGSP